MSRKPEILAPAGSFEQLYAAVRCGADAVYMAGENFNARRGAANFDRSMLQQAVQYCHSADVKTYLALNTLVTDDELSDAVKQAEYACQIGMDAIIVQDIGLASIIRDCAPDMPLHASTQCSAHTPSAVKLLSDIGFERVIAARECSKDEIAKMVALNAAEIEMFVHGALCMSVSGQCYMSSIFGARSGNRGMCAQPCRLPFSAPDGCKNALSLKDMSLIRHISEISKIGVHSLKIEGRLKRPEYVAAAVTACKSAITNGKCDDELYDKLQSVFSRSGFTDGYFTDDRGRHMFGIRRYEDVTAANGVLSSLKQLYDKEKPLIPIDISFNMKQNEPSSVTVTDSELSVTVDGQIPETALNRPLSEERIASQLKKTGSTIYYVDRVDVVADDGLVLPISEINRMRRQATDELNSLRSADRPIEFVSDGYVRDDLVKTPDGIKYYKARFGDIRSLPDNAEDFKKLTYFDTIYIPADTADIRLEAFAKSCMENGITPAVELPRALFDSDEHYAKRLKTAKELGIEHCLVNNIGALQLASECKMISCGGFGLNITNDATLNEYSLCGLTESVLSFELTLSKANRISRSIPTGLIIYGRLPLMLTRNCPLGGNCRDCKGHGKITDRKGIDMPVVCYRNGREILNPMPLYMADRLSEIKTDFGMMHFTVEAPQTVLKVIDSYKRKLFASDKLTRGLYYRTIE